MKYITILSTIVVILLVGFILGAFNSSNQNVLSGLMNPVDFYGATNASFTCPTTATTTSPILSLDSNRNVMIIGNRSSQPMFIHIKEVATTTGVAVNTGIMLSPLGLTTSTVNQQIRIDGAKGYVYCISPVAASGTVASW